MHFDLSQTADANQQTVVASNKIRLAARAGHIDRYDLSPHEEIVSARRTKWAQTGRLGVQDTSSLGRLPCVQVASACRFRSIE